MNLDTFKQIHRIYLESCPFSLMDKFFNFGLTLPQNEEHKIQLHCGEDCIQVIIIHLSDEALEYMFYKFKFEPLQTAHYKSIGYNKYLIDSILGDHSFDPAMVFNEFRTILPRKLSDAEMVSLNPFYRITDYGPNVLLQRRSKVPIRRRQVCSN
jgi:hypothetical protein